MENEQNYNLLNENINIDNDDENVFGPHKKDDNKYFFTTLHNNQDVSKNPQFIQWKKDMEKKYPFDLIVHCPKCNSYFPNEADFDCRCKRCGFKFCFGCKRYDCGTANCI